MKMNITINKEDVFEQKEIVNIDICNGNWKYWDIYTETDEKISLTMNNIYEANFLKYPVKDAYPHYDIEKARNENKLEVIDASVRTYNTLHEYLVHRINNCKENYKKHGWTEKTLYIVLFEDEYVKSTEASVIGDIVYKQEDLVEVKIEIVE